MKTVCQYLNYIAKKAGYVPYYQSECLFGEIDLEQLQYLKTNKIPAKLACLYNIGPDVFSSKWGNFLLDQEVAIEEIDEQRALELIDLEIGHSSLKRFRLYRTNRYYWLGRTHSDLFLAIHPGSLGRPKKYCWEHGSDYVYLFVDNRSYIILFDNEDGALALHQKLIEKIKKDTKDAETIEWNQEIDSAVYDSKGKYIQSIPKELKFFDLTARGLEFSETGEFLTGDFPPDHLDQLDKSLRYLADKRTNGFYDHAAEMHGLKQIIKQHGVSGIYVAISAINAMAKYEPDHAIRNDMSWEEFSKLMSLEEIPVSRIRGIILEQSAVRYWHFEFDHFWIRSSRGENLTVWCPGQYHTINIEKIPKIVENQS